MSQQNYRGLLNAIAVALNGVAECRDDETSSDAITSLPDATEHWQIWVNFDNYRKRIVISVYFPRHKSLGYVSYNDLMTYDEKNSHSFTTEITCSFDRTAEAIARDIQRKLLPSAKELYKRWLVRKTEHEAYNNKKAAIAKQLKPFGYESRHNNNEVLYAKGLPNLQIGSEVRFEYFYCKPDVAVKILEILKASGEEY